MFETMCQKKNNKKILMNKVVKRAGQKAMENGFTFVAEAVDKNRIEWVHLFLPEPEEESEEI